MIWSGVVWSVPARCGAAGLGRGITAGHGKAMFSEVWRDMVWYGHQGGAMHGDVGLCVVLSGEAWILWPGAVGFCAVR